MKDLIYLNPLDNVAVALRDIKKGDKVTDGVVSALAVTDVPR